MTFVYHERQLGGLCGVHCLNNLLQGPHFGPGDLAEIGVQLDREEGALLSAESPTQGAASSTEGAEGSAERQPAERQPYNVDPTEDGGNFSIQVLCLALKKFQLELLPAKHPKAKEPMKDPATAAEAFLCQYRDHWFAVRQVAGCWWNCNSTRKRPAMVGPFYLAAWLAQLDAEGYSIFLVTGSKLPEPAKPQDEGTPEETFHELFDLLEKGKQSGGNPLTGDGDDEEVVIPPDPDAPQSMLDPALFGLGGDYGGAMQADPASMQAIMQVLQENGRVASSSSRGPFVGMNGSSLGYPGGSSLAELRQMGYSEPQIRCAQELAAGRGVSPAEVLMRVTGVDVSVERDGEKLAMAIQEAVFGLDNEASIAVGERIMHLVSLLSVDPEFLRLASPYTNPEVLTEVLVGVLSKHGTSWTPQCLKAASIAIELLSSFPRSNTRLAGPQRLSPPEITEDSRQVDTCDGSCGNVCAVQ